MWPKTRFFISLILILLLNLADVFFAGTQQNTYVPLIWHQPIHMITLLLTMLIGYFNWKDYPEKWLARLWLAAYAFLIAALLLAGGLYLLHAPYSDEIVRAVIYVRLRFSWPLAFLAWYLLHIMNRYIMAGKDKK